MIDLLDKYKQQIIMLLIKNGGFSARELLKAQKSVALQNNSRFFTNEELLQCYQKMIKNQKVSYNQNLEKFLRTCKVRSLSGIVVVSVLTKPYPCPGKCLYCPQEPGMPKSYLSNEPAVMRAVLNKFDPYLQVTNRLRALQTVGHPIDKINIRIIGGTWSYYPKRYRNWFVKKCFQACNNYQEIQNPCLAGRRAKSKIQNYNFKSKNITLKKLQQQNEKARCKVVEISIETRQDYVDLKEIKFLRELGVTKVELGAQSLYDDVLLLNRRGHKVEETVRATKFLKDAGFKVSYQMMANLPRANVKRDKMMFRELFSDERFRPDYLKIYPLALVREAPIYQMYLAKKFRPYNIKQLKNLLKDIKQNIPQYCRVERIIRDIPATSIVAGGAKVSNLRQIVQNELSKEGNRCRCIRCREIRDRPIESKVFLNRYEYQASEGREIFLSLETEDGNLVSILRLRIPTNIFTHQDHFLEILNKSALVREVHTFGQQIEVRQRNNQATQHKGFGKRLIKEAERICHEEYHLDKIAVIAGVGARNYFRKLGYRQRNSYMVKNLHN